MATLVLVDSPTSPDWGSTSIWDTGSAPASSDTVKLWRSNHQVTGDLAKSAVALTAFEIYDSFEGVLGTKDDPLEIEASLVEIGKPDPNGRRYNGSRRINLDLSNGLNTTVIVHTSAADGLDDGLPPITLLVNTSTAVIEVRGGNVGIGVRGKSDAPTIGTVKQTGSRSRVHIGSGATLTTFDGLDGDAMLECGATTVTMAKGRLTTEGSGAITTLNVGVEGQEGKAAATLNSSGTITTLNARGACDMTKAAVARTVTNANLYRGGRIDRDSAYVTLTNGIVLGDDVMSAVGE